LLQHPAVRGAEPGQRPGQRVDPADGDLLAAARGAASTGGPLDARAAGLEKAAAPDNGRTDAGRAEQATPGNTARERRRRAASRRSLVAGGLSSLVSHILAFSFHGC